jgi:2-polyprenyl-3-methyl-5-hydroxy-6-metoxy-1,4-benzoquinol methylase
MQKEPSKLVWTPEMVERFWNSQSMFPANYFTYKFGRNIVRFLAPYLRKKRSVLDFGCGPGYLIPYLCQCGISVYGTDSSTDSVHKANSRLFGLENFCGVETLSELDTLNMEFDVIIAIEVIEHLYDDTLAQMMDYIFSKLSETGILILTTPNDENLAENMVVSPESGRIFHRWQHVQNWNRDSIESLLKSHGFEIVEISETDFCLFFSFSELLSRQTLKALAMWILRKLSRNRIKQPHLIACATRKAA